MAENGKSWQSQLGKAIGYGLSLGILLVVQHFWNAATTQSKIDDHSQATHDAINQSKADTDRLLADMKDQFDQVKAENVRLRVESNDRQRLIVSLRLDVAELKKICGIKQIGDRQGASDRPVVCGNRP